MSEELLIGYFQAYQGGNNQSIIKAWHAIKAATKFYSLFDSTGCLTKDDFESAGILGCHKALNTYRIEGGSKLTSWLIQLANQSMIKQLKDIPMTKVDGERHVLTFPISRMDCSNSDDGKNQNYIDLIFSKVASSYEPTFISDEFAQILIEETLIRLMNTNRKIYRFIKFKLENPEIGGPTCARKFGLNQSSYNKYIKITKCLMEEVSNEL